MKYLTRLNASITAVIALININASAAESAYLTIEMLGLESSKGQAVFVVMDSPASHRGESPVFSKTIVPIKNKGAHLTVKQMPAGQYSAVIYHDINGNGELDRYFFGLPKEPYGFSNDARNSTGIPTFAESRFKVSADHGIQKISVK